jgi:shikimate kinase
VTPAGSVPRPNPLVLVGMMGSGKTTVGRLLAARLGCPFADTDDEVESDCGIPVSRIFDLHGEAAFRRAEADVLARLLLPGGPRVPGGPPVPGAPPVPGGPPVIAVGGGAILDAANRELIRREATVVWLRTDLRTLADRLGTGEGRPLLKGGTALRLTELDAERRDLYESVAEHVVDTDNRSPEDVVDRVLALLAPEPVVPGP